jgi:hypothetical protein
MIMAREAEAILCSASSSGLFLSFVVLLIVVVLYFW